MFLCLFVFIFNLVNYFFLTQPNTASSSTMKLSPGSLKGENNQSLSKRALITTGTTNTLTSAKGELLRKVDIFKN